jgi:aryl-alcohol dehydrogenase-like predicted oxidoreductase
MQRLKGPVGEARLVARREWFKIADELGISLARISFAWRLKNSNVSMVIIGASRPAQVVEI